MVNNNLRVLLYKQNYCRVIKTSPSITDGEILFYISCSDNHIKKLCARFN